MTKAKRKGDGPVKPIRNWEKGRRGVTRFFKADRNRETPPDPRDGAPWEPDDPRPSFYP